MSHLSSLILKSARIVFKLYPEIPGELNIYILSVIYHFYSPYYLHKLCALPSCKTSGKCDFLQIHCKENPIYSSGYSSATSSAYFVFISCTRYDRKQAFCRSLLDSSCSLSTLGWMVLSVPTTKKSIPGMHNMKSCFKWPKHSLPHLSIRKEDSWVWVTQAQIQKGELAWGDFIKIFLSLLICFILRNVCGIF